MDRSALGQIGQPFEMWVERGKIREFAQAVHATHPDHGGAESVAPPTFLTTQMFWEEQVAGSNPWHLLGVDGRRGLHAEQEFIFHGPPPRAGTRLMCQSRISDFYQKQGRRGGALTFAVMITEFRDESGRLVAEAVLTGVETEGAP